MVRDEKEREALQEKLMDQVPEDGSLVGNTAVIRELGWDPDQYWEIRGDLIEDGQLSRGRGRGGSVRRIIEPQEPDPEEAAAEIDTPEALYAREKELYEPMREVIAGGWAKDRKDEPIAVEIVGLQGRRATGGKWTRPDIVSVNVKTWVHIPGRHLEVVTFEVKPSDQVNVSAVYEALAHLRSATHAYVLIHIPDEQLPEVTDALDEVCQVARQHGVGVIVAGAPDDYATWEEREEAQRHEPDPGRLDQFIGTQLSPDVNEEVSKAVR
jgi:hypothetical protein